MKTVKEIYMYILATIVVLAIMLFCMALIFYPIPEGNIQMVNILLGAFTGSFVTVIGYFFGSSKGSSDKNDIIKEQQKENTP